MDFQQRPINTKTLAEMLVDFRELSEYSLDEVAKLSRVQKRCLEYLENGYYDKLPADVYVKGYLRILAKIYRVDEGVLIAQFEEERGIERNLSNILSFKEEKNRKYTAPKFVFNPRTLTVISAVVVGLVSLGYLYFQVSSLRSAPELLVFSPEGDQVVESSVLTVRGRTEPGSVVYFNNQAIVVDADGEFLENISLAPGTNHLEIRSKNRFDQESAVSRSIVYREKSVAGSTTVEPVDGEPALSLLYVEVVIGPGTAWINLEADGENVYSGTMLVNSRYKIVANEQVVLTTGNAGSTRVLVNGEDFGLLGEEGEVARGIEFTRAQ